MVIYTKIVGHNEENVMIKEDIERIKSMRM